MIRIDNKKDKGNSLPNYTLHTTNTSVKDTYDHDDRSNHMNVDVCSLIKSQGRNIDDLVL